MAKSKNEPEQFDKPDDFEAITKALKEGISRAEGYEKATDDVVGYWEFEKTPILCIPQSAKLFDSNIDQSKPAMLIVAKLVGPCAIIVKEGEEKILTTGKAGDMVGIWGKPGMRGIRFCAGRKTFIEYIGERKIKGKPQPMKDFNVEVAAGEAKILPILEDKRQFSSHVITFLEQGKEKAAPAKVEAQSDDDMGDIPF